MFGCKYGIVTPTLVTIPKWQKWEFWYSIRWIHALTPTWRPCNTCVHVLRRFVWPSTDTFRIRSFSLCVWLRVPPIYGVCRIHGQAEVQNPFDYCPFGDWLSPMCVFSERPPMSLSHTPNLKIKHTDVTINGIVAFWYLNSYVTKLHIHVCNVDRRGCEASQDIKPPCWRAN